MTAKRNTAIRALGEIALRVNDLDRMQRFYEDVIGLELMKRFPFAAAFKIAEGYAGHTQILFLFDRSAERTDLKVSSDASTLDHLALAIAREDFDSERKRLESHNLAVELACHAWVKWRSMYVRDPEGNQVELVCYDDSVS